MSFNKYSLFVAKFYATITPFIVFLIGIPAWAQITSVSVSGDQILINGTPGTLNGFTFVGRVNSTSCAGTFYGPAWNSWSEAELLAARDTFHANTIRIQVNQDLLFEPASQNFNSTVINNYITNVANAVALVRSLGMVAEVSMQWEDAGSSVCDGPAPNHKGITLSGAPDANTDSAWDALLESNAWTANTSQSATPQNFNLDSGVIIELYNEPQLGRIQGAASDWTTWQMNLQARLDNVRNTGARNVVVVAALKADHMLDATHLGGYSALSYLLTDPLNSLIYAMHPYPELDTDAIGEFSELDWSRWWGDLVPTLNAPMLASEWYTGVEGTGECWDTVTPKQPSPTPNGYTAPTNFSSPVLAATFLSWLETAGPNGMPISITGVWPFDSPGYIVQDLTTFAPTFFDSNFACGKQVTGVNGEMTYEGPGTAVQSYFGSFPAVTMQLSSTNIFYPGSANMTVSVSSPKGVMPTGKVSIFDGNSLLTQLPLQGNGAAYWYIEPSLAVGNHNLYATYDGDGNYSAASSSLTTYTVSPAQVQLSASCWNSSFPFGGSYSCTANLSSNAGPASGALAYAVDGLPNSVSLNNGSAQFSVATPNAGSHVVSLSYSAQGNFSAAGPVNESFTVTPAPTQIQLTPSSYYQSATTPLTLTATLTSWSAGAPTDGTVAFYDGTVLLGSGAAGPSVTFTTSALTAGTQSLTAVYSPEPSGNFAAAASSVASVQLY